MFNSGLSSARTDDVTPLARRRRTALTQQTCAESMIPTTRLDGYFVTPNDDTELVKRSIQYYSLPVSYARIVVFPGRMVTTNQTS